VHGDQAQRAMASSATHSDDISSLINGVESIRVAGFGDSTNGKFQYSNKLLNGARKPKIRL